VPLPDGVTPEQLLAVAHLDEVSATRPAGLDEESASRHADLDEHGAARPARLDGTTHPRLAEQGTES
jgi:hypothetical protein